MKHVVLVIAWFCCVASKIPKETRRLIEEKETFVQNLAIEAEAIFRNRSQFASNCECSIHICRTGFSQRACNYMTRSQLNSLCQSPSCPKPPIEAITFVETPLNVERFDMGAEMKENICLYKFLEPVLTAMDPMPITTTRIAAKDGHMRIYPGNALSSHLSKQDELTDEVCPSVDPRGEAFYVGASAGPKDIVFVIDASLEMKRRWNVNSNISKLEAILPSIQSLLNALCSIDHVNLVAFSDQARRRGTGDSLYLGTERNLALLKSSIGSLAPFGNSNVLEGIELGFDLLIDSSTQQKEKLRSGEAQKVLVVISGSRQHKDRNRRPLLASEVLKTIEKRQQRLETRSGMRAMIFTFSVGKDADEGLPKQIACANDGAWFSLDPEDDASKVLNSYNSFLALAHGASYPIWTNFREDPYLKEKVVTVAKAFHFFSEKDQQPWLLGVIGHDVRLKDLMAEDHLSQNQIEKILKDRSRRRDSVDLQICQLQVQRNVFANGSFCVDLLPIESSAKKDDKKDSEKEKENKSPSRREARTLFAKKDGKGSKSKKEPASRRKEKSPSAKKDEEQIDEKKESSSGKKKESVSEKEDQKQFKKERESPFEEYGHKSRSKSSPRCFEHNDMYFKAFVKKRDWNEAKSVCREDGGDLAELCDEKDSAFLASIASADGSWIYNRRKVSLESICLEFPNKIKGKEDLCLQIDNRGAVDNLKWTPCEKQLSYICGYPTNVTCSEVVPIPKRGYFRIPDLNVCEEYEEALANAAAASIVTQFPSSQFWCSLDHGERDLQSFCCRDCEYEAMGSREGEDLLSKSFMEDL